MKNICIIFLLTILPFSFIQAQDKPQVYDPTADAQISGEVCRHRTAAGLHPERRGPGLRRGLDGGRQ